MDTHQINKQQGHKVPNSRGRTASEQISPGPTQESRVLLQGKEDHWSRNCLQRVLCNTEFWSPGLLLDRVGVI